MVGMMLIIGTLLVIWIYTANLYQKVLNENIILKSKLEEKDKKEGKDFQKRGITYVKGVKDCELCKGCTKDCHLCKLWISVQDYTDTFRPY